MSAGATLKPAICIACGCDDDHGCPAATCQVGDERTCFWLQFDAEKRVGLCSECGDFRNVWKQGAREPIYPLIAERYYRQVLFLYEDKASALAWMLAPQYLLRQRSPRDLILAGDLEPLQVLVDMLQSGAFA